MAQAGVPFVGEDQFKTQVVEYQQDFIGANVALVVFESRKEID